MRIWRDRSGDSFRGWLRGITRNKLREFTRKNAERADGGAGALLHLSELPERSLDEPPEQISELYLRDIDLVKHEFTQRTWSLFWRIVVDGQTAASVANEFDINPAAARMAKSRVLRRLREEVGDVEPEPLSPNADN